jgi:hypothetical protein
MTTTNGMETPPQAVWRAIREATPKKVSMDQLMAFTGCSRRTCRAAVNELRSAGFPIVNDDPCTGFWTSNERSDIEATIAYQQKKIRGINRAIEGLRTILARGASYGDSR